MLEDNTAAKFNKIRWTYCLYHGQDHILVRIQNDTWKALLKWWAWRLNTQFSKNSFAETYLHTDHVLSFLCSQAEDTLPTLWNSPSITSMSEQAPMVSFSLRLYLRNSGLVQILQIAHRNNCAKNPKGCEEIMWWEVITLIHEIFSKQSSVY